MFTTNYSSNSILVACLSMTFILNFELNKFLKSRGAILNIA